MNVQDIPPMYVLAGASILYLAIEARLARAGYIRKPELEAEAARAKNDTDKLGGNVTAAISMITTVRGDLDATRDRVTHLESKMDGVHQGVVQANKKLDQLLGQMSDMGRQVAVSQERIAQLEKRGAPATRRARETVKEGGQS